MVPTARRYHGGPFVDVRDFNLLYRAPLVRALLAGWKTQTRRLMKPQPTRRNNAWFWTSPRYDNGDGVRYFHTSDVEGIRPTWGRANPFGPPGSTMHARENYWRDRREPDACVVYAATPELARYRVHASGNGMIFATFEQSGTHRCTRQEAAHAMTSNKFWSLHPSIHMPAWACRIRATLVRVEPEQVWYISNADARAEGIPQQYGEACALGLIAGTGEAERDQWDNSTSAENFLRLFYGINRRTLRDRAQTDAPWVWKVTFRDVVVDMPERAQRPYLVWRDDQHAGALPR